MNLSVQNARRAQILTQFLTQFPPESPETAPTGRVFIPKEVMDAYIEKNLLGPRSDFVLKALTLAFMKFPKPSICAVNGLTVGGGVNFAWFFHDIVIASESSKFKYPFTDIGITPELASSALLPLAVGPRQSKRLFLLGPWVSALEALSMGLVDEITPNDMLMPRAKALAEKLIQKSLVAVRLSKQLVLESMGGVSGLAKVLDREAVAFAKAFSSDEFAARVSAFRKRFGSKRSPRRRLSAKL